MGVTLAKAGGREAAHRGRPRPRQPAAAGGPRAAPRRHGRRPRAAGTRAARLRFGARVLRTSRGRGGLHREAVAEFPWRGLHGGRGGARAEQAADVLRGARV